MRSRFGDEAEQLISDLLYTEKAHFASAESAQRFHRLLGGTAAVAGAVAAAAVVAEWSPSLAAISALTASASSAVLTLVNPQESAQQHLDTGRSLAALRVEVRQTRDLDLDPRSSVPLPQVREALRRFADRKSEIDRAAPGLQERPFRRAQAKVARGDFEVE
ncbi:SLATT domain-containing protein [Nocardia suismassiliense]|uniref:SLATT domain-containing protein n=1 Tax=Nocardia suismassiliense TaxID=2077092 RepID=UPI00131F2931|nr:SLATT domain-containing protein [Nocardia suismassiliense]